MGLRGAGEDVSRAPWILPDWEIDSLNTSSSQPSDYASTILGMLAAGQNPADINGRNLVAELTGLQSADGSFSGPLNQTIWAIIALDTAQGHYNTDKAVAYLINNQKSDGGYALVGDSGDADTTGMALIALAAHPDSTGVNDSINAAKSCLKTLQSDGGGFCYGTTENCESTSLVIRGLLACGEDVSAAVWQKNTHTMVEALLSFQQADGAFAHINGGADDYMATRQALIALGDLPNGDVFYNIKKGKMPANATVRVRVEGADANLADTTVTVSGTAMDALKAAVGSDQVAAPDGFISSIKGETGHTGLAPDIDTSWFFYIIRNGAIDTGSLSSGPGSYNVRNGDQIIFYIGAYGHTDYAPKTYFPMVSVTPQSPSAGQTINIKISAQKYDWSSGLTDLSSTEAAAIGEYTVLAGETSYTSQSGQVDIPCVSAGTLSCNVTNPNAAGYPNVVPFGYSITIAGTSSHTAPTTSDCIVEVAVVGVKGELLYGPDSGLVLSSANKGGKTVLGALDATGLTYTTSTKYSDFVDCIAGQSNSGQKGWMFTKNGGKIMQSAGIVPVSNGDQVIWYYSNDINQTAPTWNDLLYLQAGNQPSATPVPVTSTSGKAVVDPAAGGFIGQGTEARVEIPPGALTGASSVQVAVNMLASPPSAPSGFMFLGQVYEFTVDGSQHYKFNKPVTLSFSFDPAALLSDQKPAIFYYDAAKFQWVELGGTVSGNTINVPVDHFTKFAVLADVAKILAPAKAFRSFGDIKDHWAEEAVEALIIKEAIGGYPDNTFKPDNHITRAEFVSILNKAIELPVNQPAIPDFNDVSPGDWYYQSVENAFHGGIIRGYGQNFRPDREITREEMAAILVNAMGKNNRALAGVKQKTGFTDDQAISNWSREFVIIAVQNGLITGYGDNSFNPKRSATRAEACTMMMNFLNINKSLNE